MATIAILTAAGKGLRTNLGIPKQFYSVEGKPIIIYTLEAFQKHPAIDEICVVVLAGWEQKLSLYARQYGITKIKYIVKGGETGQESIYRGIRAIRSNHNDNDVIIIHDGDRPMVSEEIISDNLEKQKLYGSAVAVVPCTEVVFQSKDGVKSGISLKREELWRTQTPHSYMLADVWSAYIEANRRDLFNLPATCSIMQALGNTIFFSIGSVMNLKITTPEDIEIFRALLIQKTLWHK